MMAKFLGKQKPLEKINLAERLNELSLDQFFGSESWPEVTSSLLDRKPFPSGCFDVLCLHGRWPQCAS